MTTPVRKILDETLEAYGKLESLLNENVRQDAIEDILLIVRREIEEGQILSTRAGRAALSELCDKFA